MSRFWESGGEETPPLSRQRVSCRWRRGCLPGEGRGLSSKESPKVRFVYHIYVYIPIRIHFYRCAYGVCVVYLEKQPAPLTGEGAVRDSLSPAAPGGEAQAMRCLLQDPARVSWRYSSSARLFLPLSCCNTLLYFLPISCCNFVGSSKVVFHLFPSLWSPP